MRLADYLRDRQIRPSALALAIGLSPSTVTRILRGERTPSLSLIARIREATDGAVTADDFLPAREPARQPAPAEAT